MYGLSVLVEAPRESVCYYTGLSVVKSVHAGEGELHSDVLLLN